MSLGAVTTISKAKTALSWFQQNCHFMIAAAILGAVALAIAMLGWVVKEPVPWPEDVVVDEGFRLLSLPAKFGPYVKVLKDGVCGKLDGKPDGERILESREMRALGMGTSYDKDRYPKRRSNWYVSRMYEDERISDLRHPYKYWRLEIYYYTGLKDKVPHVPERCGQAGGATLQSSKPIAFRAPAAREPWDRQINFQRVHFEFGGPGEVPRQAVEYYVFSFNGKQERAWEYVRLKMALPIPRYNYFAKIQFAPAGRGMIDSVQEADQAAAEFIKYALPSIVQTLPSAEDVERLTEAEERNSE